MTAIDRQGLIDGLRAEGLDVTEWFDDPHATYPEHTHPGREVRVVLEGTMTILVDGTRHELGPGERLDLRPRRVHSAVVGPSGCRYLAGSDR